MAARHATVMVRTQKGDEVWIVSVRGTDNKSSLEERRVVIGRFLIAWLPKAET